MKTFSMEMEIRRVNALYVNPLVRCDVCQHRVCRCNDEPEPRKGRDDSYLDDPRHGQAGDLNK